MNSADEEPLFALAFAAFNNYELPNRADFLSAGRRPACSWPARGFNHDHAHRLVVNVACALN